MLIQKVLMKDESPVSEPAAEGLSSIRCTNCNVLIVQGTRICPSCDFVYQAEGPDWTDDDPVLQGARLTFKRGENPIVEQLIEEGDPGVTVVYDRDGETVQIAPSAINRMAQPGAAFRADRFRIKRARVRTETTERSLWSFSQQATVSLEQKHREDYNKQWVKVKRADCNSLEEYMARPENEEYLVQMVLRPHLSQNHELKSPRVHQAALRVAESLGILTAIQTWWATIAGANAQDVLETEPNGHNHGWMLWCFLALAFFAGMMVASFINWMVRPKKKEKRSIGVQSHTTYSALTNAERPRFRPLPDRMHGAYE